MIANFTLHFLPSPMSPYPDFVRPPLCPEGKSTEAARNKWYSNHPSSRGIFRQRPPPLTMIFRLSGLKSFRACMLSFHIWIFFFLAMYDGYAQ